MNKKSIIYITLILVFALTNVGFNSRNNTIYEDNNIKKYLDEQNLEMSTMMEEMKNIKPTGDPAIDFLYGMISHHKSAVEMSKSLLKYGGQNAEIKKIAENTIKNQSKEIEQMKDMIKRMELNPQIDEKKEQNYLKEYNNMLNNDMNHSNMSNLDSVDKSFAIGMIKHHKMAIAMSEIILKYTDNQEVVNLANNIIESQKGEIKQMEQFVNIKEKTKE